MRYRFPYVGTDLHKLVQPGISELCETMDNNNNNNKQILQNAQITENCH